MLKRKQQTCASCRGEKSVTCTACNGSGKDTTLLTQGQGATLVRNCWTCHGSGKRPCLGCGGKGYTETFDFDSDFASTSQGSFPDDWMKGAPSNFGKTSMPFNDSFPNAKRSDPPPMDASSFDPSWWGETGSTSGSHVTPAEVGPGTLAKDMVAVGGIVLIVAGAWLIMEIGLPATLVVFEVFCVFGGWLGMRAGKVIGTSANQLINSFGALMAITAGICGGTLAAYLVLTTAEGYQLIRWVTDNTLRMVASLFASIFTVWLSDHLFQDLWNRWFR